MSKVIVKAGHNGNGMSRYHTDREKCRRFPEKTQTMSKAKAESRGMTECKFCSGEAESSSENDGHKYLRLIKADD